MDNDSNSVVGSQATPEIGCNGPSKISQRVK